jgi:hypothetical protein
VRQSRRWYLMRAIHSSKLNAALNYIAWVKIHAHKRVRAWHLIETTTTEVVPTASTRTTVSINDSCLWPCGDGLLGAPTHSLKQLFSFLFPLPVCDLSVVVPLPPLTIKRMIQHVVKYAQCVFNVRQCLETQPHCRFVGSNRSRVTLH